MKISKNFYNFQSVSFTSKNTLFTISFFNGINAVHPAKIYHFSEKLREIDNSVQKCLPNKKNNNFLTSFYRKNFLPRNYPHSVREHYISYCNTTIILGSMINMMNFLSTKTLINHLGTAEQKSIPISAGLNWVLKNGIGQFSSFIFGSVLSHSFEINLKQWRFTSFIIGNIAIFIEMFCMKINSPMKLLFLSSLAQIAKLCGIIGIMATQCGINAHFCKENNIADLQSQFRAQNQFSFFLGTLGGMASSAINSKYYNLMISAMSFVYLSLAYKSITMIDLNILNENRMKILCDEYLRGNDITVRTINQKEGCSYMVKKNSFYFEKFNFSTIQLDSEKLLKFAKFFKNEKFMLIISKKDKLFQYYTLIEKNAKSEDVMYSYYFSMKIKYLIEKYKIKNEQEIYTIIQKELINSDIKKHKFISYLNTKGFITKYNLLEKGNERYQINKYNH